jgi:hypothetical protein
MKNKKIKRNLNNMLFLLLIFLFNMQDSLSMNSPFDNYSIVDINPNDSLGEGGLFDNFSIQYSEGIKEGINQKTGNYIHGDRTNEAINDIFRNVFESFKYKDIFPKQKFDNNLQKFSSCFGPISCHDDNISNSMEILKSFIDEVIYSRNLAVLDSSYVKNGIANYFINISNLFRDNINSVLYLIFILISQNSFDKMFNQFLSIEHKLLSCMFGHIINHIQSGEINKCSKFKADDDIEYITKAPIKSEKEEDSEKYNGKSLISILNEEISLTKDIFNKNFGKLVESINLAFDNEKQDHDLYVKKIEKYNKEENEKTQRQFNEILDSCRCPIDGEIKTINLYGGKIQDLMRNLCARRGNINQQIPEFKCMYKSDLNNFKNIIKDLTGFKLLNSQNNNADKITKLFIFMIFNLYVLDSHLSDSQSKVQINNVVKGQYSDYREFFRDDSLQKKSPDKNSQISFAEERDQKDKTETVYEVFEESQRYSDTLLSDINSGKSVKLDESAKQTETDYTEKDYTKEDNKKGDYTEEDYILYIQNMIVSKLLEMDILNPELDNVDFEHRLQNLYKKFKNVQSEPVKNFINDIVQEILALYDII